VCLPLLFSVYAVVGKMLIGFEMEERMEKENLQAITLQEDAVIWLKKDKEILVDGEPFDIKRIQRHAGVITVWGLYDAKEKALKKNIRDYLDTKESASTAGSTVLLFMFTACSYPDADVDYTLPFVLNTPCAWHRYQGKDLTQYIDILKPPPRMAESFIV
jgi:hypothetical protein